MSMVIKNLSDFLSVLIQTLNLPALFPATIFIYFSYLFVFPVLPHDTLIYMRLHGLDQSSLIMLGAIMVVFITYILDGANLKIIRFFEGYNFLNQFPFRNRLRRNQELVKKIWKDINSIKEKYNFHVKQYYQETDSQEKNEHARLANYYATQLGELFDQITHKYPENPDFILPFRLGNIIAAAEEYPNKILGMDAIVLWPFLRHIISDKNYAQFYVKDKAILDFLLNMIVILACFGMLSLGVELFYNDFDSSFVLKGSAIVFICFCLLRLAVQSAMSWGTTVRVAFIIFKEDLRNSLQLIEVESYEQEKKLWKNASKFFGAQQTDNELLELGKEIFRKNRNESKEN